MTEKLARLVSCQEQDLRTEVIATARRMFALGLVPGSLGNVSVRFTDALLITPTRTYYDDLEPADLPLIGLDGTFRSGVRRPSRELPLHLSIYRARSDVDAVVHTHSLWATAWSFLGLPLEPRLEDLEYESIGAVRTSEPARAGTTALAHHGVTALGDSRAALLGGHGVVSVGADLRAALIAAELVERQAHVSWLLRSPLATLSA